MQAQPGALRSKEDQALLDLAEQEGMRRCPACGAMVQRTQVSAGSGQDEEGSGLGGCTLHVWLHALDACICRFQLDTADAGCTQLACCRGWCLWCRSYHSRPLSLLAGLLAHGLQVWGPVLLRLRQAEGSRLAGRRLGWSGCVAKLFRCHHMCATVCCEQLPARPQQATDSTRSPAAHPPL